MQTFLPYSDFHKSALMLDKKRAWKQVLEAKQIIDVLEKKDSIRIIEDMTTQKDILKTLGWINHPAVKMWEGHIPELKFYFNAFLVSCIVNHGIKTKYEPYLKTSEFIPRVSVHDSVTLEMPWWMGDENFHRAMRARLIEKNEEFYLPLFPDDKGFNNGKYLWPLMDGSKTFKII